MQQAFQGPHMANLAYSDYHSDAADVVRQYYGGSGCMPSQQAYPIALQSHTSSHHQYYTERMTPSQCTPDRTKPFLQLDGMGVEPDILPPPSNLSTNPNAPLTHAHMAYLRMRMRQGKDDMSFYGFKSFSSV
jgi:hypothetical protein